MHESEELLRYPAEIVESKRTCRIEADGEQMLRQQMTKAGERSAKNVPAWETVGGEVPRANGDIESCALFDQAQHVGGGVREIAIEGDQALIAELVGLPDSLKLRTPDPQLCGTVNYRESRLFRSELIEQRSGSVRRSIVHEHEICVDGQGQELPGHVLDVVTLVVCWDEDDCSSRHIPLSGRG